MFELAEQIPPFPETTAFWEEVRDTPINDEDIKIISVDDGYLVAVHLRKLDVYLGPIRCKDFERVREVLIKGFNESNTQLFINLDSEIQFDEVYDNLDVLVARP